ncbi:MAG TPA: hypothetical protein DDY78_29665 [Planctomycetales bacterium]|jgi:uncharacterized protein (DUF433 family)|nr:hypothetical protein [Planctomycetales bacterium]
MTLSIHADQVPLRVTPEGDVRIGATRVLLDLVVHAFDEGATPEAVVQRYPTLRLADVYAVMAYRLLHRAEVDAYLQRREERADEVRRKIEARQGDMSGIRERLLARRAEVNRADLADAGRRAPWHFSSQNQ